MMKNGDIPVYWVINFRNQNSEQGEGKIPSFDFVIPQRKKMQALNYLKEIQESCKNVKQECHDTIEHKEEPPFQDQISNITDDIKSLFAIIKEFTNLMRQISPEEEEPPEKKS